ncbi:MAG: lytic murein transglycosylase [Paraglaciecola sp.]|uniref:lytic murein transglycosylase n=1 Tax=Paraglaciecola sp. TaxID=1920173 RepID=UPI0032992FBD
MVSFSSYKGILSAVSLSMVSLFSSAQEFTAAHETFPQCIDRLQQRALAGGVSQATTNNVLAKIELMPRLLEYDRNQPEFVQTFTGYFSKRVTNWRIDKGREKFAEHREFLAKLTQEYGVPAHYLMAFWGLETNFGNYKGKIPTLRALTTLACDQRRSNYFSSELVKALLLLERENLEPEQMVGSWAGAMGHTQFMPSAYLKYSRDGDGDGKIDLWNSEQDALASAANFLKNLGWKAGFRWGREVQLPEEFNYQLAGKSHPKSLSFWNDQQVTQVSGQSLGNSDIKSALLIPAGYTGSAFLVYSNFDVILRWNNSEYYGIAVGHLADRIAGKETLSKPLPDLPKYTLLELQKFQEKLNELGFEVGKADGILGPATRKGIRGFQVSAGLIADGYPSTETVKKALQSGENGSQNSL